MELIIYFLLEIRIDDNHIKLVSQFEEENIIVFFFLYSICYTMQATV